MGLPPLHFDWTFRPGDIFIAIGGLVAAKFWKALILGYRGVSQFIDRVDHMDARLEATAEMVDIHTDILMASGWHKNNRVKAEMEHVSKKRRRGDTTSVLGLGVLLLALPFTMSAQTVQPVPDAASYATAAVNPALATIEAWGKPCRFGQLLVSEGIGNGAALILKHFIVSARPCVGCAPDGMPSGHTMNSFIGYSRHPAFGLAMGFTTGALRHDANRHTWTQIGAGAGLGIASEWIGRSVVRCQ